MKSPEYVAIVVSTYRRALDAVAAGTFVPNETAVRDLTLSFNRGFTRGYLFGDHGGKLMGRDRPDNRGLCIGTVTHCDARNLTATVHLEQPVLLHPGDGLLFSHPDHPSAEWGYALNSEPERQKEGITLVVPRPVQEEARVFLTASVNLAARARQISRQGTTGLRQPVPVDIAAAVSPEGLLTLAGTLYPPGKDPVAVEKAGDLRHRPGPIRSPVSSLPYNWKKPGERLLPWHILPSIMPAISLVRSAGSTGQEGNFSPAPKRYW